MRMEMTNLLVLFGGASSLFTPTISLRHSCAGYFAGTESRNTEHSDSRIRAKVKGTLLFRSDVNVLGTTVHVKDGVVTLRGAAKDSAEKSLITRLVTDIKGVTKVINNLAVNITTASS
jgi:osmotically-inducible protein OsmY